MYNWLCVHGQVQCVVSKVIFVYHYYFWCVMLSVTWLCGCKHAREHNVPSCLLFSNDQVWTKCDWGAISKCMGLKTQCEAFVMT